jgi:class 3 adenylate cyclase
MHVVLGWERPEFDQQQSAILREAVSPQDAPKVFEAMEEFDVTALLNRVRTPTLVLVSRDSGGLIPAAQGRAVAAAIPGAQLSSASAGEVLLLVDRYLGLVGDAELPANTQAMPASGTAVILFADIVNSTALSEQMGDAAFRERSRELEERIRATISERGGRAVDGRTLGDGVLSTFTSASDAIAAALDCARAGEETGLALHLGLHAGDVLREQGNVYGQAVSIAARVSDLSAPNEVLVSGTVRDLARASVSVSFEDRGERELKGVGEPVRVFAVHPTQNRS